MMVADDPATIWRQNIYNNPSDVGRWTYVKKVYHNTPRFRVVFNGGCIVLQGCVSTYHDRQQFRNDPI